MQRQRQRQRQRYDKIQFDLKQQEIIIIAHFLYFLFKRFFFLTLVSFKICLSICSLKGVKITCKKIYCWKGVMDRLEMQSKKEIILLTIITQWMRYSHFVLLILLLSKESELEDDTFKKGMETMILTLREAVHDPRRESVLYYCWISCYAAKHRSWSSRCQCYRKVSSPAKKKREFNATETHFSFSLILIRVMLIIMNSDYKNLTGGWTFRMSMRTTEIKTCRPREGCLNNNWTAFMIVRT